ncbi:N-acetylmuramoyl-L-alanine amidase [Azospirillum agricola]|uniref:N-acetylmuramoyl-L-alanine amidase n=1 Tax=Azospirillum agricola TaxID=1720247 RepID=UPI001F372E60|nr:N-acetylmuramoyl-L-alanine amidase [Azospirillum agricola]MBP2228109.1 N-acetylmuramoyl-L-alanine amidase [Azospirillum agricola]
MPARRGAGSRAFVAALLVAAALETIGGAAAQTTAALPAPPPKPAVVDARLGLHPDKTRFVLEVSDAVPFTVTLAANPYRIMVDLPELVWPGGGVAMEGKGLVARYRYGVTAPGTLRLTFETVGPAKLREAYTIPARDGRQPRLVLDIERVTPAEFQRLAAASPPAEAKRGAKGVVKTAAPFAPLPTVPPAQVVPAAVPAAPPVVSPPPAAPKAPSVVEKPLVVLDPGHGGADPGAVGVGGLHEKDITLAAAREAKRQLEATGRYRVRLTRDSDVFIRLRDRVAIAREANADLFISLHADSIGSGDMRGLSIYTLSDKASDREAEMLAAKENRADAIAGMDLSGENSLVASILIDLAQRDTMNHSKRFAKIALDHLGRDVKLIPSKPHRQAGFAVLTAPDVPSALIEMGYLSSKQDANLLTTATHREKLGRSLARTIDAYFKWLGGMARD